MKLLFVIPFVLLVGFILWMNLTPGHFQDTSDCSSNVEYITNDMVFNRIKPIENIDKLPIVNGKIMLPPPQRCELSIPQVKDALNPVLILLTKIDFYK